MKRVLLIAFIALASSVAMAADDYQGIIAGMNLTDPEKKALVSFFEDAGDKGLDNRALVLVLREQKVKGAGYFDILKALLKKEEVLFAMKSLDFPFQDDQEVGRLLGYAVNQYSLSKMKALGDNARTNKMSRDTVAAMARFLVSVMPYKLNETTVMNICNMMAGGAVGAAGFDTLTRAFLRYKELRRPPEDIASMVEKELLKGTDLRKIIKKLEENR